MMSLALFSPLEIMRKARRLIALLCCLLVVFTAIVTLMVTSCRLLQGVSSGNDWHQTVADHPKAMDAGYQDRYSLTCNTQNDQNLLPALLTQENQKMPLATSAQYMMMTLNPMVHDTILYLSKNNIGSSE